jgi:elongation factor Ts
VSATITAAQVKELRDRTGAGMMDCKAALQETNGDSLRARPYCVRTFLSRQVESASRTAA